MYICLYCFNIDLGKVDLLKNLNKFPKQSRFIMFAGHHHEKMKDGTVTVDKPDNSLVDAFRSTFKRVKKECLEYDLRGLDLLINLYLVHWVSVCNDVSTSSCSPFPTTTTATCIINKCRPNKMAMPNKGNDIN